MGKYRKSILSLTSLFIFISLQRRKHCPCLSLVLNPFKSWSASMQCATGYDLTSLYMVFQCCISVIHKYRGGKNVCSQMKSHSLPTFIFICVFEEHAYRDTDKHNDGLSGFFRLWGAFILLYVNQLWPAFYLFGWTWLHTNMQREKLLCLYT